MGHGGYSTVTRSLRSASKGYATKSSQEIFKQRNINNAMSPYGLRIRESRDSKEHPNSFPIIIALDVTGSMGSVPHFLVKEGLPVIMENIISAGIADPQVLFLGIGDHECDEAPVQVGQFESSDELLDKWLTDIYMEGGGGGNNGESYLLAWYVAAKHTNSDSFMKRQQKGVLFTIGDEPTLHTFPGRDAKAIFGDGQYSNEYTVNELLEDTMKNYDVYHININETSSGSRLHVHNGWKQLLSEHALFADRREDVVNIITDHVLSSYKNSETAQTISVQEDDVEHVVKDEEIIL